MPLSRKSAHCFFLPLYSPPSKWDGGRRGGWRERKDQVLTYWDGFERNLYTAMDNAMEELSRSYQSSEKTAGKADQGADHGTGERKLHGKKLILPALALVLGFFLALLLVGG